MRSFLWSQFRFRRSRVLVLGAAILVAAVSFVLLTSTADTSSLRVHHVLSSSFRPAYDILVRPRGSETSLERRVGLVRANYLSGIFGGISLKQYHDIEKVPGVDVAAPIANVGTVLAEEPVVVRLNRFLGPQEDQLFRVRFSWLAQRGLSHYPGSDEYLYVTRRQLDLGPQTPVVRDPATGGQDMSCNGYNTTRPLVVDAFAPINSSYLWCASYHLTPALRQFDRDSNDVYDFGVRQAWVIFEFEFPLNLAAVDPTAEGRLVGLRGAMAGGRYLSPADRPRLGGFQTGPWREIPVLAASRSFLDEQLQARIERLVVPPATDVPGMLGSGACGVSDLPARRGCRAQVAVPTEPGPPGHRRETAFRFVSGLRGRPIGERSFSAQEIYARAIRRSASGSFTLSHIVVDAYWRGSPVSYRQVGPTTLEPSTVSNGPNAWLQSFTTESGYLDGPTDTRDVQFRKVSDTPGKVGALGNGLPGNETRIPMLRVVGRFDPLRLRGFSRVSRVPLETYYPPTLDPADARSRALLDGKPLLPSQNIGDYIQQPPLLITNLASLAPLFSEERFDNVSPLQLRAPISVVRVRVKGVHGLDALSVQRIRTVATLIHDRTGLPLDITAGSSPTGVTVRLPKGRFGRPPLLLGEGWVQKGAAVTYLRALDRKDVALFALILLICAFFLANGALAAVRARRSEIGVLRTVGWPRRSVFTAVLSELALVGLIAGSVGTALALVSVAALDLRLPVWRVVFVLPLAVLLAVAAGLVPASLASRGSPLDAVLPPFARAARGRRARRVGALALVNLRVAPARTLIAAAGLFVGVAALTVLVGIERAFQGTLVGTLLGNAISVQVRGADFAALAIAVALATFAIADVLYLNLRERAAEFASLRAVGWGDSHIARVVLFEALGLGLLGSVAGAVLGVVIGAAALSVPLLPLIAAAAISASGGIACVLLASLVPLSQVKRLTPHAVLAEE